MNQMQRRGGAGQGKTPCQLQYRGKPLFSCSIGEIPLLSSTICEGLMLSIFQRLSLLFHCLGLQMEEGKRYASMDGDADRIVYYTLKDGEWKGCASVLLSHTRSISPPVPSCCR